MLTRKRPVFVLIETFSSIGRQQTWQSSIYCWLPPEISMKVVKVSPQNGQLISVGSSMARAFRLSRYVVFSVAYYRTLES